MAGVHPGQIIAKKYQLLRMLGEGAMGAVYEAEHAWTGRRVALKVLREELASRPDLTQRFMQEARIATRIAHPHIVQVLDMGTAAEGGALFIVYELLQGETLREWIRREHTTNAATAIELMVPVVAALCAAHARGVIHRDIKPENIFLAKSGSKLVPKLIDFGISKVVTSDASAVLKTGANAMLGTPEYMAPEQVDNSQSLDARADLWAVGIVLYELLAGTSPFRATSVNGVLARLLMEHAAPLESVASSVPESFAKIVNKLLRHPREERFASAEILFDELVRTYETLPLQRRFDTSTLRHTGRRVTEPRPTPTEHPVHEDALAATQLAPVVRPTPAPVGKEKPRVSSGRDTAFETLSQAELTEVPVGLTEASVSAIEAMLSEGRLQQVLAHAERLLKEDNDPILMGRLRAAQASAYNWLGDPAQAAWCATQALERLRGELERWLGAASEAATAFGNRGDDEALVELCTTYRGWVRTLEYASAAVVVTGACIASQLVHVGWPELAEEMLTELNQRASIETMEDPLVRAWMLRANGYAARVSRDPTRAVGLLVQTVVAFEDAGDRRNACLARADLGDARRSMGDYAGAERVLRVALAAVQPLGLWVEGVIQLGLAVVRGQLGASSEARDELVRLAAGFAAQGDRRLEARARLSLAEVLLALQDFTGARREAKAVLAIRANIPAIQVGARVVLSTLCGGEGKWSEALSEAERAMDQLQALGALEEGAFAVHLAYALALAHTDQGAAATEVARDALTVLQTRANAMQDVMLRRCYLQNIPAHRVLHALVESSRRG